MSRELYRVCDGQNKYKQKHRFGAAESFKQVVVCPICGRPMELVELSIDVKNNQVLNKIVEEDEIEIVIGARADYELD
ncbi:MAG: hypothetical protein WC169_12585 [Dehalococcoidia bacterium]